MKLRVKLQAFALSVLLAMTVAVLIAGSVIVDRLAHDLYDQILKTELEVMRVTLFDTFNSSGEFAASQAVQSLNNKLKKEPLNIKTGHAYVIEAPDRVIYHPDYKLGERIEREDISRLLKQREGMVEYEHGGSVHYAVYTTIEPLNWLIFLSMDVDEIHLKQTEYLRSISLIALVIVSITVLGVSLFVTRFVGRLRSMLHCVEKIKSGRVEICELPKALNDEIGWLQEGIATLHTDLAKHTIEQREAEKALEEQEIKFRTIADHTYDWEYWLGPDKELLYISPSCERVTGYTASEFEDDPDLINQIIYPEDQDLMDTHMNNYHSTEDMLFDFRIVHKDGSVRWITHGCQAVYGRDNEYLGRRVSNRDDTGRKLYMEKLASSEQLFRTLVENSPDHIARYDLNLRRIYLNPSIQKQFTVPVNEAIGKTSMEYSPLIDPEGYMDNIRRVIETGLEISDELSFRNPEGEVFWASTRFAPEFDVSGKVESVLVISNDITEHKIVEQGRQQYLRFLESLDRINKVLSIDGDMEDILDSTLDVVLKIFGCDRAYLQYPCDPDVIDEWFMPIERCSPEYPNPFPPGQNMPFHPHIAETMRAMLESDGPIKVGFDSDFPIPPEISEKIKLRSMLAMAIYPNVDRPWQFGIHQCSYNRVWSEQEERLFAEIGRRISDGLNSLLITRDLRESEARFRQVFESSAIPIWEEDFSAVKAVLDEIQEGIEGDIESYLHEHPDVVRNCASLVRVVDINDAVVLLHDAKSKESLLEDISKTFLPESYEAFLYELTALVRGKTTFSFDGAVQTLSGERKDVSVYFTICPGYEDSWKKVVVSLIDITERKQADEDRQSHLSFLESLDRVNLVLQEEGSIEEIMNRALDEIRLIFDCDRTYLLYPCDPQARSFTVPIESTTSEYPGAHARDIEIPSDNFLTWLMQSLLDSDHPIQLGKENDFQISELLQKEFNIRSIMAMAIYPRVDKPWQFGIHQCSYDRVWSDQELRLFEEIGRRLSDSLNTLLVARDLGESEERYHQFFDNSPLPIREEDYSAVKEYLDELGDTFCDDMEGYLATHPQALNKCAQLVRVVDVNNTSLIFHEAECRDQLLNELDKIFIPESLGDFVTVLVRLMHGETSFHVESVIQTLKGRKQNVLVHFSVSQGYEDSLGKILVSMVDITERKHNEDEQRLAASVFTNSQEAIIVSDADNRIIDVNPAFTRMTGYTLEDVLGEDPKILSSDEHDEQFFSKMWESINNEGEWRGEIWNRRKSGELYPELLSIAAVTDDKGTLQHYVGAFTDITMLKQHEADLDHIAHYDVLTSVPNRRLLDDRLAQAIANADRRSSNLAVCYLDLDGFKPINDEYGHEAGDLVLIEISNRLQSMLRAADTIARLGGDEFVLLWNDVGNKTDCIRALERVLDTISKPIQLGDNDLSVSASIGVTLYPDDNVDADSLLRHADHAMYSAKQLGKNCYQMFDTKLERQISTRVDFLDKIKRALKEGQFELYYQPKVDYFANSVQGVEALLRWNDPILGLVGPKEFLPLIENENLACDVGRWVMEKALQQANIWNDMGMILPISINIFPRHIKNRNFTDDLGEAINLQWPEMPSGRLQMEIVESSALEDLDLIESVIDECKGMGVSFSLDDFGTGYSSLVYLRRLSIDEIKIDQSFVRDMLNDQNDQAIVMSVIGLGEAFGLRVVAEGVETTQHAWHLMDLGCRVVQGYALGRPMPVNELEKWYAEFLTTGVKMYR